VGTGFLGLLAFEFLFGLGEAAAPTTDPAAPAPVGLEALVLAHSERTKLSPRLVRSVIAVESEFQPGAVSPRGARGLMQVMPATAEEFGVPARLLGTPDPNLRAGTTYLSYLYRALRARYGLRAARLHDAPHWAQHRVLAAYNGGPRLLFQDHWPGETRRYVRRVARLAGLGPPRLPEAPAPAPQPAPAVVEEAWNLEM
jgi:soluble lytic murein transglycosylase-like protein